MKSGERLVDALTRAGGLSEEANSEWLAKSMNQAELLRDGMKLYVPFKNDVVNQPVGDKE